METVGPELIENFILYLTGQRMSQEDAITVHYALLENSLSDSQYTYRNSSQLEISRNVKSTWYNDNKTNLKIRHDLREYVLKQGFSYNPETMDTKTLKQLHYFLETGVLFNSAANALGATDEGYTTPQQADNPCDEYDIPCLIIYKMTDFLS